MAQPPQQGQPVSLLMHPSSSVSGGSTASNGGSPSMQATPNGRSSSNWDGDKMLHVYMIDYCRKRGFSTVVNALCATTGNPSDVKAPIDAPQGLLFEWWVVFWDIFTAKTEDDPKKNAVAYIQDQRAKNYRPMHPTDVKPPIGVQIPGHNFNGPHPPPSSLMGHAPFPGHPTGHPNQQHPGMQPMPTPNGVLPPGQQQQHPPQPPSAPTPIPPPSQHVNGPQPYPPQQQTQQPPHPNPANGPQGPPPNQAPGVPNPMVMANRPGGPTGPQMPIGAQRGGLPAGMQNGQVGHQPFSGSPLGPGGGPPNGGPQPSPRTSHMGPPQGVRPHPQQPGHHPQQQGGPANAPTPGSSGMINGMGPNQTPLMAAQQFMNAGRPGSRSGTPGSQAGGGSQPGISMSPSRIGGPPMQQPGAPARPGSQMGVPQQPGGHGSPFTGPMPGPAGFSVHVTPQMVDQAIRTLGINKPQESLTPEERSTVHTFLKASLQGQAQIQGQRQSGMGTPRLVSGGNPMMTGASQPGQPGPQGGMPGTNYPQQQQLPQPQMVGQPGQPMMNKRPGSPMQMDPSTNENSPPDRKRLRKDSQNGPASSGMPGFAPGAPAANGMPGQPPMLNGAGNPNMMRLPQGAPGNPGQAINPMMANGPLHGPGANAMQTRPPQPPPGQQRFPMHGMPNKPPGLISNPHAPGLPIPVKNEDLQQQVGNMVARGPPTKVHPSPSIPNAKAGGSMPPPSHTPNPSQAANKATVKDEDGAVKSSPGMKPATQNPPTPIPNPATPANAQNPTHSGIIFNSTIAPSPSAILANQANMNQSTPPTNASRPGSSANPQSTTATSTGGFFGGGEMYVPDFNLLDYGFGPGLGRPDDLTALEDNNFDILNEFLNPSAVGGMQDDEITAAGGSS